MPTQLNEFSPLMIGGPLERRFWFGADGVNAFHIIQFAGFDNFHRNHNYEIAAVRFSAFARDHLSADFTARGRTAARAV